MSKTFAQLVPGSATRRASLNLSTDGRSPNSLKAATAPQVRSGSPSEPALAISA